ncbi:MULTISPECIES: histidine kinase [unclassified Nocardioides]|uniref:histidine kinase n=1 Tax=unclassified Nocardioides TaxID=2615069 RepID=UPI0030152955
MHDGLGPALAGIRLGLQGARNLLADHPEAGLELLAHLQAEVDLAVEAVRSLDHQLSRVRSGSATDPGLVGTGP